MSSPLGESNPRLSCWPSDLEALLLRAGLCAQPKAVAAWREFCARIEDIETLDHGCYRLFPLVAANLQGGGEDLPHFARIAGVLRHAWVKNQHLLGEVLPVMKVLQKGGIPFLLLKGAALSELYRRRGSVRSMDDVDLLVHPEDLARATAILTDGGFSSAVPPTERDLLELLRYRHELTVRSSRGATLDIHWYLVSEARHLEAEEDFWRDATPYQLQDFSTHTLLPSDQFLHTCLHGAQWNEVSPVRWLADAAILIDAGLDWNRIEKQARRLEHLGPVRDTLLFLEKLEVELPSGLVENWRAKEVTDFEKIEGNYRAHHPNLRDRSKQLAWTYLRLHKRRTLGEFVWNVPHFMRQLHHFRAYSRRVIFLWYLLFFSLKFRRGFAFAGG